MPDQIGTSHFGYDGDEKEVARPNKLRLIVLGLVYIIGKVLLLVIVNLARIVLTYSLLFAVIYWAVRLALRAK